jgi:hypothetical protein
MVNFFNISISILKRANYYYINNIELKCSNFGVQWIEWEGGVCLMAGWFNG